MAKQRKKVNKLQLLWIGLAAIVLMGIILTVIFLFMDTQEPEVVDYAPPPMQNFYNPDNFALDENGFMTCLSQDYSVGIDVSSLQGEIVWQEVKDAGVEFVFIRVGRRGTTEGLLYPDDMAQDYYKGAKEVGLKIGAYFYSQATSPKEAEEEAWFVLKEIADWELDLPVVYDWEWGGEGSRTTNLSPSILTQCNLSFCQIIYNAGLEPMIYFNRYQGLEQMDLETLKWNGFWLAMYDTQIDFPYPVDCWQYSETGTVPGIQGNVDLNIYLHE